MKWECHVWKCIESIELSLSKEVHSLDITLQVASAYEYKLWCAILYAIDAVPSILLSHSNNFETNGSVNNFILKNTEHTQTQSLLLLDAPLPRNAQLARFFLIVSFMLRSVAFTDTNNGYHTGKFEYICVERIFSCMIFRFDVFKIIR